MDLNEPKKKLNVLVHFTVFCFVLFLFYFFFPFSFIYFSPFFFFKNVLGSLQNWRTEPKKINLILCYLPIVGNKLSMASIAQC